MIGTITLNPCIDKTVVIDGFHYGGMNRVSTSRDDVSGKGINVSIALSQLQAPVCTLGIDYKDGAQNVGESLAKLGMRYKSVEVEGKLRVNIKVMDQETSITTELNQKGDYVDAAALEKFNQILDETLEELDILVVTGSVPPGIADSYYYDVVKRAKEKQVKVILDAEGTLLMNGLKAKPYLIKPNLYEFEMAFGLKSREMKDIINVCRKILGGGVEVVCLSMGEEGAVIVDAKEAYLCRPSNIEVQSTQGAGDSLVAGICIALEEGKGIKDMLRYGVACAQGSLIKSGTQLCEKHDFESFRQEVRVEKIKG